MFKPERFENAVLNDFISFADKKPTDEMYMYGNSDCCAVAQFRKSRNEVYGLPSQASLGRAPKQQPIGEVIERIACLATGSALHNWGTFGEVARVARHVRDHNDWPVHEGRLSWV